jgi:hypothetical protein
VHRGSERCVPQDCSRPGYVERGGLSQYGRVQVPAVQTQAEPQAEPEPAKKRTKKRAASDRAIQNPQKKAKVAEVVDAGCVSLV